MGSITLVSSFYTEETETQRGEELPKAVNLVNGVSGITKAKGWLFDGLADPWWFMYLKWFSAYLMVRNKPPQSSVTESNHYYLLPLSSPLEDLHHRCILDIGSAPVILHGVDSSVSTGHGVSWGEDEGWYSRVIV